jgi:transcriptional regulator with XRE-family HTH domain
MINYDETGISDRLLLAAQLLGMNDTELAKEMGVKKQMIGQLRNNSVPLPAKRAIIFLGQQREIDARWLFFNEGDMMVKPSTDGNHEFILKNSGDGQLSAADEYYKMKYEGLNAVLKEKEKYIKVVEKAMEMQEKVIDKLMARLG